MGVLDSYENPSTGIADFVEAFENEAFDTKHIAAQQPMVGVITRNAGLGDWSLGVTHGHACALVSSYLA